jgi:hypothetical protein
MGGDMAWVEVPVPAEFEQDVKDYLTRLSFQNALVQWDEPLMAEHLLSLEEEPRILLGAVAAGVLKGHLVEDTEMAELLGVNVREVYGVMREANGTEHGDLIYARAEESDDGSGGMRTRRVLYMLDGYAHLVRDQEAALGLRRRRA